MLPISKYLWALCCFSLVAEPLLSTVYTVSDTTDVSTGTGTGTGTSGSLRYCINQANNAPGPNTILFGVGGTFTLSQPLPPLLSNIAVIDSHGQIVTINGQGMYQTLFAQTGAKITISNNIKVENGASIGGTGGACAQNGGDGGGAGGGALGAGGGLFVAPGAQVAVSGVTFTNCFARGGAGGSDTEGMPNMPGVVSGGGGGGMAGGTGGGTYNNMPMGAAGGFAGGGGGGYGGIGGSASDTGGGGGGGLLFAGGSGDNLDGGGGGGSDKGVGSNAGMMSGGNGGPSLFPLPNGTAGGSGGAADGATGGDGTSNTGNSGGGGGGAANALNGQGGAGGSSAMGGGGGGGVSANGGTGGAGGSSTGSFGGGGGGGGSSTAFGGGAGGSGGKYAGGGGGGSSTGMPMGGLGGNGGFGGGGGGSGQNAPNTDGFGNGGFGAGGGGGYANTLSGLGGFAGGEGGTFGANGGGGGGALGGTVFVGNGATLTFNDPMLQTEISSLAPGVTAGAAGFPAGSPGTAAGPDFFLMSSGTLVFNHSTTFTVSTPIASDIGQGGGNLTVGGVAMQGTGTLILSGVNTYTGVTACNAGVIQVSMDTNLGSLATTDPIHMSPTNSVSFNGGTLQLTAPFNSARSVILVGSTGTFQSALGTSTWSGLFTGPGRLIYAGPGTLALTNAPNTYLGGTTLLGGTLQIQNPSNLGLGGITFGGGTLELTAPFGAGVLPQNIVVNAAGGTLLSDVAVFPGVALSGNIIGTVGMLTLTGASPITLAGTNPFSGTFAQVTSSDVLNIHSTNALPVANVINTGLLAFSQTGTASVAGSITGPGSMVILPGAQTILTGSSAFTGPTAVFGSLVVDGSSVGSPITVLSGGMLSGIGTVQNVTVQANGTLAPGHSPGTLTGNNFTFEPGSIFTSQLTSTAAGQVQASGTVNIQPGALLNLVPQGVFVPSVGRYILINSAGLTGSEFSLTGPLPPFILEVLYSPTMVQLLAFAPSFQDQLPHGNPKNAAVCFQTVLLEGNSSTLTTLNKILDLQSIPQLQRSFNQMQPANFDTIVYAGENVGEQIRQLFTSHLFEQHAAACKDRKKWSVWATPFAAQVDQDGKSLFSSYRERFAGVTTAIDYRHRLWTYSAGFSYAATSMRMPGGHAHAYFNAYATTLAASWSNHKWFADIQTAWQYSPLHAHRSMKISVTNPAYSATVRAKAHHHNFSNQAMGHVGGGYIIKTPLHGKNTFQFYPFAGVDYFYDFQTGYTESGAGSLNLRVLPSQYDYLRPELGIGMRFQYCARTYDVDLGASVSDVMEFRQLNGEKTHAHFAATSCKFEVSGLNPENNLICPQAHIKIASPINGMAILFGYHGEFGEHFRENSAQIELRKAF